jgi:hypothetical protein
LGIKWFGNPAIRGVTEGQASRIFLQSSPIDHHRSGISHRVGANMKIVEYLALVALLSTAPAHALADGKIKRTQFAQAGGWSIFNDENSCKSVTSFKDNSGLIIEYDKRLEKVTLYFSDPSVKSLNDGDERKLKILLLQKAGNRSDTSWGSVKFNVTVTGDGTRYFVRDFKTKMLGDLAKNDVVAFFYHSTLVKSFKLTDSAAMTVKLKACAAKRAALNPSDPFR